MESEENLIERIVKALPRKGRAARAGLRLGAGDDAAILRSNRGLEWVVSCDTFLEGVHFLARTHPAKSVGYKSVTRAVSDLAAMGGIPRLFLIGLVIPKARTGDWLDELLSGMARACRELDMVLAGGDTTRGDIVSLGMTVLGEVEKGRALRRSGARPGDLIYVSGKLGEAQLGLELVLKGLGREERFSRLVRGHLYPTIPLRLGCWLQRTGLATAAIDISDGLSTDLVRLTQASRVGARIFADKIPAVRVPETVRRRLSGSKLEAIEMALHGGDDYQLLFTVPAKRVGRLRLAPGGQRLRCIGEVTSDRKVSLVDSSGKTEMLEPFGWDPFRG